MKQHSLSLLLLFTLLSVATFVDADATLTRPRWNRLPPKYDPNDPNVEPINPRNLAGQVVLLTGDRTGQGRATAELFHFFQEDPKNLTIVIGISSHQDVLPGELDKMSDFPWIHYKADISDKSKVDKVMKKIKRKLNDMGIFRIHNFILNAGRMGVPPPQDTDSKTIDQLVNNNFYGNLNVFRSAQENGLVDANEDTRVGWTSSTGAVMDLNFVTHYSISKMNILTWIQYEQDLNEKLQTKVHHFAIAPWAIVGSNITCHKTYFSMVDKKEQVCSQEVDAFMNKACPNPKPEPGDPGTYVEDVALFWRGQLRFPIDNLWNVYNFIDSATPMNFPPGNPAGGMFLRDWIPIWERSNPKEYAKFRLDQGYLNLLPCTGVTH